MSFQLTEEQLMIQSMVRDLARSEFAPKAKERDHTKEFPADNLKKHGGFVPGIRPGKRTAEYLDYVLMRLSVVGAIYLVVVCLMPELLISNVGVPFYFGGTSLLIVVSVTMDTITQVQSHLLAHQYQGLIKKSKIRGR